jgi:hypothetical protein
MLAMRPNIRRGYSLLAADIGDTAYINALASERPDRGWFIQVLGSGAARKEIGQYASRAGAKATSEFMAKTPASYRVRSYRTPWLGREPAVKSHAKPSLLEAGMDDSQEDTVEQRLPRSACGTAKPRGAVRVVPA